MILFLKIKEKIQFNIWQQFSPQTFFIVSEPLTEDLKELLFWWDILILTMNIKNTMNVEMFKT